jgi:hypothetical protein
MDKTLKFNLTQTSTNAPLMTIIHNDGNIEIADFIRDDSGVYLSNIGKDFPAEKTAIVTGSTVLESGKVNQCNASFDGETITVITTQDGVAQDDLLLNTTIQIDFN